MSSLPLDFRLGVPSVVGVESVSAALHQHGECDSEHLDAAGYFYLSHFTDRSWNSASVSCGYPLRCCLPVCSPSHFIFVIALSR